MATTADLRSDLVTALTAAGFTPQASGTREEQLLARSASASRVVASAAETVDAGSNLTVQIVTVDVELISRAAGSTLAQIATAEAALDVGILVVAAPAWWGALTAARRTPVAEIEIGSEFERIGETVSITARASVALEG